MNNMEIELHRHCDVKRTCNRKFSVLYLWCDQSSIYQTMVWTGYECDNGSTRLVFATIRDEGLTKLTACNAVIAVKDGCFRPIESSWHTWLVLNQC